MDTRSIGWPDGYDRNSQRIVGLFAAQLDDQLANLKRDVAGLSTLQLEWQLRPGMNTVGMLLAHLAVVEVFWLNVAIREMPPDAEREKYVRSIVGISFDDDGIPLAADAVHPKALEGRTLESYLQMLDRARASVHGELRHWRDEDLEKTFVRKDRPITRSWTLYHVLEHFAAHYGQILILKHMMRDIGVLAQTE